MFHYITFLAVVCQVANVWCALCESPCPIGVGHALPAALSGLGYGGHYPGAIAESGLLGAAPVVGSVLPAPIGSAYDGCGCIPAPTCINHRLEAVVRPVVDECVSQVPVVRKSIRHQEESFTRHVPVVDKLVTQQEEKYIRHVPVTQKCLRNVVECRTRHVPIVKSRTRTVVEPYTTHVPITEKYTRPVEECITKHVPIVERRCRPVVHQNTRLVPVTERRLRPIVDTCVSSVPVKRRYVKNLVEQRVRAVAGPCQPCIPGADFPSSGLYPTALPLSPSLGAYPADVAAFAGLPVPSPLAATSISADYPYSAYPNDLAHIRGDILPEPCCPSVPVPLPGPCGC